MLMGTNCAPLVAGLFLFCYGRDSMLSLADNNEATDVIEAFGTRYLDDLLNIDNPFFLKKEVQIYPKESQVYEANILILKTPFGLGHEYSFLDGDIPN